jgi:predicted nucleotidyltransferase
MPVPSLSGSVRRWPAAAEVLEQAGRWATQQISDHPDLVAVGVFGSYGRGTAGVGSDLDLLLYSLEEWRSLPQWNPKLAEALLNDTRWLGGRRMPWHSLSCADSRAMVSLMVRRGNRQAGSQNSGQIVIKLVHTIRRVLPAPAQIQPSAMGHGQSQ